MSLLALVVILSLVSLLTPMEAHRLGRWMSTILAIILVATLLLFVAENFIIPVAIIVILAICINICSTLFGNVVYVRPVIANRRFENIFAWYALASGIIITYLIHLPCESVLENIDRLPLNATREDIHRAIMDANDGLSAYEDQCINLWWRSAIFLTLLGGVLRIFQQRFL